MPDTMIAPSPDAEAPAAGMLDQLTAMLTAARHEIDAAITSPAFATLEADAAEEIVAQKRRLDELIQQVDENLTAGGRVGLLVKDLDTALDGLVAGKKGAPTRLLAAMGKLNVALDEIEFVDDDVATALTATLLRISSDDPVLDAIDIRIGTSGAHIEKLKALRLSLQLNANKLQRMKISALNLVVAANVAGLQQSITELKDALADIKQFAASIAAIAALINLVGSIVNIAV
jgi:hypothetical protein